MIQALQAGGAFAMPRRISALAVALLALVCVSAPAQQPARPVAASPDVLDVQGGQIRVEGELLSEIPVRDLIAQAYDPRGVLT